MSDVGMEKNFYREMRIRVLEGKGGKTLQFHNTVRKG